ncbi:DUF6538 domain-containing protein [Microbulbifer sp.]|uniref:DUF6538 domain-containing protein n=1 Tax=Microbulbifer sp. TaxID=1908541 RepID=UPI002588B364|nr:DUF6538 domain-containing protein [Microbulbifer sp.]
MTDNTKYLTKRGDLYMFNWRVPKDCVDAFDGKRFVSQSLKTHSLKTAKLRRNRLLVDCEARVQEARDAAQGVVRAQFKSNLRAMQKADWEDLQAAWSAEEEKEGEPDNPEDLAYREALRSEYLGYDSELAHCTLRDALSLYMEDRKGVTKDQTFEAPKRAVRLFCEHIEKDDITLKAIQRPEVKAFIKDYTGSTNVLSSQLAILGKMFDTAQDHGQLDAALPNPFRGHKLTHGETQSYQLFTKAELAGIMGETRKFEGNVKFNWRYWLPRLGYATGCRLGELINLSVEDVEQRNGAVVLSIKDGKTANATRHIPLFSGLASEFLAFCQKVGKGRLWPKLQRTNASKQIGDIKRKLGITERQKSFHSFRVHMASNLERAEVPENRAVWILGHTRTLSLSYGLYSKGPSLEQLREDVESAVGYGLRGELGGAW